MANLALHNTTFAELQDFFQKKALSTSEKFTVIFNKDIEDFNITSKSAKKIETSFHDFTKDEFLGMWADREDIQDSTEFVKKMRSEQWG